MPARGAELHSLVHNGLAFDFYRRIADILNMSVSDLRKYSRIDAATLARRAVAGRFSTIENDRLCGVVGVFHAADALFDGNLTAATEWMIFARGELSSRAPLEMMWTRVEA
ncbi:antitoxin [Pseudomonas sp. MWU12-2312b]|uniref:antitoxin Xre-like helix-turn-helix domain-containing protein n=1 Tax=Pseudomonas moorei TaxID=395599 RepID=UPI000D420225|nr:antitoxin [Pseudomonas sp. MWU12-2312b]